MSQATKTIPDPELGEIKLTKYKGAKNIRIRVKEDSKVAVSLPYFVAYDEALRFLVTKRDWVKEQMTKLVKFKVDPDVKTALEKALRTRARAYLPGRLEELANKHGLKYRKISIRNTKTRWGSCSHENNINLCIHLMKLPDELIDYVLLHELTHTIHKNHSREFWAKLSELLGENAKTIDKKLKKYRPDISLV